VSIVVGHEMNAGNAGLAAFDVGAAAKRKYEQEQARKVAEFDAELRLQYNQMAAQAKAQEKQQEFQGEQTNKEIAANTRARAETFTQQSALSEERYKQDVESATVANTRTRENTVFQDELTKGRIQFEYTEQQKREMEKYGQGLATVNNLVSSGQWTAEQGQKARDEINAKLVGISKSPVPKYNDEPTAEQTHKQNSFKPGDGSEWVIDAKGGYKQIVKPPEDMTVERQALYNKLYTSMMPEFTKQDKDGNDFIDFKGLKEAVANSMDGFQEYNKSLQNRGTPQSGQPQSGQQSGPDNFYPPDPTVESLTKTFGSEPYAVAVTAKLRTLPPNEQDIFNAIVKEGNKDKIRLYSERVISAGQQPGPDNFMPPKPQQAAPQQAMPTKPVEPSFFTQSRKQYIDNPDLVTHRGLLSTYVGLAKEQLGSQNPSIEIVQAMAKKMIQSDGWRLKKGKWVREKK
jgi:hypothetical protein